MSSKAKTAAVLATTIATVVVSAVETPAEAAGSNENSYEGPYFYGCVAHKNQPLSFVTNGMTYEEAFSWAMSSDRMNEHGKKRAWGLYTAQETDAKKMAIALGGGMPPILDAQNIGSALNNHYHVYGYDFQGYFKHFYIWYGCPQ